VSWQLLPNDLHHVSSLTAYAVTAAVKVYGHRVNAPLILEKLEK